MARLNAAAIGLCAVLSMPAWADGIAFLTTDLVCWGFATPPPPYHVYTRWAGSPALSPTPLDFPGNLFATAIGEGPNGEVLVGSTGKVSRLQGDGTLFNIFDLPAGFEPTAILSHRSGKIVVLGELSGTGNVFATWTTSSGVVVQSMPGNGPISNVDLDPTGCELIQARGGTVQNGIYRLNICTGGAAWQLWLPIATAGASILAPGNRLLVWQPHVVLLVDASTGATIRTYTIPSQDFLFALNSTGRSFFVAPSTSCNAIENVVREYEVASGALLSQRSYVSGGVAPDLPFGMAVMSGWRAALNVDDSDAVAIPAIERPMLWLLFVALATISLARIALAN